MRRLLPLLLLAACETGPDRAARLQAFVGRPEGEVIAALGVPVRTYEADGLKFLQYEEQRTTLYPGDAYYGRGYRRLTYLPAAPIGVVSGCGTTLTLKGGVVQGFSFNGDCR